jgi:tetratricopeptide (TPR) repeat protein
MAWNTLKRFGRLNFKRRLSAAQRASARRDWTEAVRLYEEVLALRPNLSWLQVQYGHALKEAHLLEKAYKAYQRALRIDEGDEETYYHLISVLQQIGLKSEAEDVTRAVVTLVERGKGSLSKTPYLLLNRLKAKVAVDGFVSSHEKAFEDLLDTFPTEGIFVQYGNFLKDSGRLVEAEAQYYRALEKSPRKPDTYLQLGHALKLQGRINDAIDAYRTSYNLSHATHDPVSYLASSELDALKAPYGERVELPDGLKAHSLANDFNVLIAARDWPSLADLLLALLPEGGSQDFQEFTCQILLLIGDHHTAHGILERLSAEKDPSEKAFLIMAREKEREELHERAAELYGEALKASMHFGEAFEALVRLKKHKLLFEILEPSLFPKSSVPPIGGRVAIAAAGRTPGLLVDHQLAQAIRETTLKLASDLEERGYNAQSRLFYADAALIPQSK